MQFTESIHIPYEDDEQQKYIVTVILEYGTSYSLGPMSEEVKDIVLRNLKDDKSLNNLYKIWKNYKKIIDEIENDKKITQEDKDKASDDFFTSLEGIIKTVINIKTNSEYEVNNLGQRQ